ASFRFSAAFALPSLRPSILPPVSLSFVLKTAWRDARPSWRRLVFTAASVVLGVAALVAVGSFGTNLQRTLDDQARGLLGADLEVSARSAPTPETEALLAGLGRSEEHTSELQ